MKRILLALGLLVLPLVGWAQSCPYWQQITFVDGKKACLGEYPLFRASVAGVGKSVESLVSNEGLYAVSAALGEASCPAVLGTAFPNVTKNVYWVVGLAAQREQDSLRACEANLSQLGGRPGCACAPVLLDGVSRLTKAEFNTRFLGGSPGMVGGLPPAPASPASVATASPAPAVPALSCPYWQQITFVDGKKACLGEYELLRTPLPDVGQSVQILANNTRGLYSVSAPIGDASCPMVMGAAFETSPITYLAPELAVQRTSNSMRACETRLSQVVGNPDCACAQVVADGTSRLTKAEFDARFRGGSMPPSAVAAAAAAAAAPAPAAAPMATAAPPPTTSSPALAPTPPAPPAAARPTADAPPPVLAAQASSVAAAPAPATAAPQVPRMTAHALVIGNSKYSSFGALANPGRDAKAIADKLKSFGIPVDLLLDAQRDDLIHALNEHSRRAAGKDISLLFYAGHGVQVEGTNYLIPVNMRADGLSAGYVKLAGISLNATLDYMPAKTRLIFLDACRDNPAARVLVSSRGASAPGLAAVNAASGTLFSYATRDGATADDGDGLNSPYTTALLKHLDKPMDISLVLRQVRQTVLQLTGGRQEPWEYGSLVGDQIVLPLMAR